MIDLDAIVAAEVLLPCAAPNDTARLLVDELGFRVEAVRPADDPEEIVVSGHGTRVALSRALGGAPGVLRLRGASARVIEAADGTRIEVVPDLAPLSLPPLAPSLVVSRLADAAWIEGRASMRYRDLIGGRQGGRYVASHIRVDDDGPVPDYVHHHHVRFQMIFCVRGSVVVAYEDQGPPLTMQPGDCVLQPPGIRHRVLEAAGGLEVVELGCPAAHETRADHAMTLPTSVVRPERRFEGQQFVHHRAADATWTPGPPGFARRDTGIADATDGLAAVSVLRFRGGERDRPPLVPPPGELRFYFVLSGEARLGGDPLRAGDAVTFGAGIDGALTDPSDDLCVLEVHVPEMRP